MKKLFAVIAAVLCLGAVSAFCADDEARIDELIGKLTLAEKISLLHADSKFTVAGVTNLGIPSLTLSDGPHGVREELKRDSWESAGRIDDSSIYLATGTALAATWNVELARRSGECLGAAARSRGKDIILGPGINIHRTPLCGRNFEYYSEDPCLVARMVAPVIQGIQSQDTVACVKHFALNNQELDRFEVNVEVGERALREIYLPGFEAAIKEGGALAVMGSYSRFRGVPCVQSQHLVMDILKGEWGFKGILMTDWCVKGIVTKDAACNGLDLEMGTEKPYNEYYFADPLHAAITNGQVAVSLVDEKVRRMLRVMFAIKAMGDGRKPGAMNTTEQQAATRAVASEAMVLLRNNGILPLNRAVITNLVVIGDNADKKHSHGGQSSAIKAIYEITPLNGITRKLGEKVKITCVRGYDPKSSKEDGKLVGEAVAAAKAADAVIVFGGLNHDLDTESCDRPSMKLPGCQDRLIREVIAVNPRTVVVLAGGSPVEMPWFGSVPAVLWSWYAGMEGGNALADILFGDVNPSGKMPFTIARQLSDCAAHSIGDYKEKAVEYKEDLLVGYRWFDTKKIVPLVPFGHGLSYTTFKYTNLKVEPAAGGGASVSMTIANTGKRAGSEVVQLYVAGPKNTMLLRPAKELKAFRKVRLEPGKSIVVEIDLSKRDFSYYSVTAKGWAVEPGVYTVMAGSSSRDIRLKKSLEQ